MNLVPFDAQGNLPAYLTKGNALDLNKDIVTYSAFPHMSIKGMKFTIVRDGTKTVLTKPEDPDEVAQSIGVVVLRANMHSKVFYLKKYKDGESDGARPDCYSFDGKTPSPNAPNPQHKNCGLCPHNEWGSRVGDGDRAADGTEKKGKACADNARLAISAPDKLDAMLLRVPPASLKNLRDAVKVINQRKIQYNAVVLKVGFDREAPSPVLTFKPVGLLDDATYDKVCALYESETVRGIVGVDDLGVESAAPAATSSVDTDELDAAIAARDATSKAKAASAPAPAPAPEPAAAEPAPAPKPRAAKPKAEPAPAPAPKAASHDDLLSDLDSLLGGGTDD